MFDLRKLPIDNFTKKIQLKEISSWKRYGQKNYKETKTKLNNSEMFLTVCSQSIF